MSAPYRNFDDLHTELIVLSGLCSLAARISVYKPEWELSALLTVTEQLVDKLVCDTDSINLTKGGEA